MASIQAANFSGVSASNPRTFRVDIYRLRGEGGWGCWVCRVCGFGFWDREIRVRVREYR